MESDSRGRQTVVCPMCKSIHSSLRYLGKHLYEKHLIAIHSEIRSGAEWKDTAIHVMGGCPMAFPIKFGDGCLYKCPGCEHVTVHIRIGSRHLLQCANGKKVLQRFLSVCESAAVSDVVPTEEVIAMPVVQPAPCRNPTHPKVPPAPADPPLLSLPVASIPPSLPPTFTNALTGRAAIRLCISTTAASVMNSIASAQPSLTFKEKEERRNTLSEDEWLRIELEEAEAAAVDAWKRVDEIGEAYRKAHQYMYLILSQRRDESSASRQAYQNSAGKEIKDLGEALEKARALAFATDTNRDRSVDRITKAKKRAEEVTAEPSDDVVEEIEDAQPARTMASVVIEHNKDRVMWSATKPHPSIVQHTTGRVPTKKT